MKRMTDEVLEKLGKIEVRLRAIERKTPKVAAWSKASIEFQKMRLAFDVAASSKDMTEAKGRIKMLRELVKEMED